MRALLVVKDGPIRTLLESVLSHRGWETFSVEGEEIPEGEVYPASLLVVEQRVEGPGAGQIAHFRRSRGSASTYVIGLFTPPNFVGMRRLIDAGVEDVVACPAGPREIETRIAAAEARLGKSAADRRIPGSDDQIERRFHVQQAFLDSLFEAAPEGVVIMDVDGRVVRINPEFERMFGYSAAEAEGRPLNELIVPEGLEGEGAELDGGVRRGERVVVETVRQDADGRLIDVSVLANNIDVDGPVGTLGIYRDITEKKRQEAELRASEERYRALFDQSPVGVFLCDRGLRITLCNNALTRIVGAPYEEILGAHLVSLRDRRLIPGLRAALDGKPASYEGPYRSRSGVHHHVAIQYAPLRDDTGEVVGGMGVMEDVTDRVKAERESRAYAAEMERVNSALRERTIEAEEGMRARTRLYTAMNHELRTPISAVMLYQELLIAGSLGPLTDEQAQALEHSHTATSHLLDLVKDILDLSKIEAGKVDIQPTQVNMSQLLDELSAAVTPVTERHGSALAVEVVDDPGEVVTDPQRVRQILMNFVSNAAKFGRQRPITIRCLRRGEADVVLEVIDQGIGIANESVDEIFEDFVQLESDREDGTGLGLAICKRLAELLGAHLEVESRVEQGSTFRLVLPGAIAVARASAGDAVE